VDGMAHAAFSAFGQRSKDTDLAVIYLAKIAPFYSFLKDYYHHFHVRTRIP